MSNEPTLIEVQDAFIIDGHYHIYFCRCSSMQEILGWIAHLSEKTWVTPDLIGRFVLRAADRIGIDVYMGRT